MPSQPSTRPSDSTGRRSSAFAREDGSPEGGEEEARARGGSRSLHRPHRAGRRTGASYESGSEMTRRSAVPSGHVRVGRVYDPPSAHDGTRVLVDRLWPRGLKRDAAALAEWCREIAPSNQLRAWYGHDPDRWAEFAARYRAELDDPQRAVAVARLAD